MKENPNDGWSFLEPRIEIDPSQPPVFQGEELLACLMQKDLAHLSNLFFPCFEGRLGGVGLPLDELGDSSLAIAFSLVSCLSDRPTPKPINTPPYDNAHPSQVAHNVD